LEAILAELMRCGLNYSQYLGFLDIIGKALNKIHVECFRINGKMSLKEQEETIATRLSSDGEWNLQERICVPR
jgi:hypothetical protein